MNLLAGLLGVAHHEPGGCVIEVGTPYLDRPVLALYPFLKEVTVDIARGKAGEAKITFGSRRQPDGRWDVEDSGVFRDWTPVRISAAFGLTAREEVLRGVVREIKAQHPPNTGESSVEITIQDLSLVADREHRREVWGKDTTTSDAVLVPTLLARNQLTPHPDSGPGLSGITVNQDGTDAALMRARAEANGYELAYEGDQVFFGPLQRRLSGPPSQATILVDAGSATNCLSLDVQVDGRKPDVVIIDFAAGKDREAERVRVESTLPALGREPVRSSGSAEHSVMMSGQAGDDRAALERKAQSQADALSLKVKATGELDGTAYGHVLRAGYTVRVDGIGPRFSGTHLVDAVNHRFNGSGYTQRFTLLRNAYDDDGSKMATSPLDAVLGS